MKCPANGLLVVERNAVLVQLIIVTILSLFLFVAYSQAGFYGITLFGIALITTPSFFLSISLFSFLVEQSQVTGNYKKTSFRIMDRLNKMQWAVINYQIFLPLLNVSGMFIINLVMIGLFCVIAEVTDVIVWYFIYIYIFKQGRTGYFWIPYRICCGLFYQILKYFCY